MNLLDRHRHDDLDEIDAALNALMSNASYRPNGEHTRHILDTHRMAMSAVRSDPVAMGPATGTWNRVLRATAQPTSKGFEEMAAATWAESKSTTHLDRTQRESGGLSRITTTAATLAIVSLLAFGGWFAATNLNQGGNGNGLYGLMNATPDAAPQVCDVEPLTIDQVMAIVENPWSVDPSGRWGEPTPVSTGDDLSGASLREVDTAWKILTPTEMVPDQEEFEAIYRDASQFLRCQQHGTMGQLIALIHPEVVQQSVLAQFPIYRDPASLRAAVEQVIDQPARMVSMAFVVQDESVRPAYQAMFATDDSSRARLGEAPGVSPMVDRVVWIGLDIADANGNLIGETDWDGMMLLGDRPSTRGGYSLIFVYSQATDTWYYQGIYSLEG